MRPEELKTTLETLEQAKARNFSARTRKNLAEGTAQSTPAVLPKSYTLPNLMQKVGTKMLNYATDGGDYLGLAYQERLKNKDPKAIPYKNNAIYEAVDKAKSWAKRHIKEDIVGTLGNDLYVKGTAGTKENQDRKQALKAQLPLTELGKAMYDAQPILLPEDRMSFLRATGDPGTHTGGIAMSSQFREYSPLVPKPLRDAKSYMGLIINPNPGSEWYKSRAKNEVILHELSHAVDKNLKISQDPGFEEAFYGAMENNQHFYNYVNDRLTGYSPRSRGIEMYTMATEYLNNVMQSKFSGPRGFPRELAPYFPHIKFDEGYLTSPNSAPPSGRPATQE